MQGLPQEEQADVEESFQLAQTEEIPPQEGDVQDYIETVFEEKLSEGIERGLSPEDATIAAIEVGRNAIKEVHLRLKKLVSLQKILIIILLKK